MGRSINNIHLFGLREGLTTLLFDGCCRRNLTGAGAVTLVARNSLKESALGGSDWVIIFSLSSPF